MIMWSALNKDWGLQSLIAGCLLLTATAGCGSPASDMPPNGQSQAATGKSEDRTAAPGSTDTKSGQNKTSPAATGSAGNIPPPTDATGTVNLTQPLTVAEPQDPDDLLNVPEAVAKGLSSSDAHERSRALDHWEKKGNKTSVDPVFDLMDDEDPEVRAKAEAIIEKYLESEADGD